MEACLTCRAREGRKYFWFFDTYKLIRYNEVYISLFKNKLVFSFITIYSFFTRKNKKWLDCNKTDYPNRPDVDAIKNAAYVKI